MPVVLSKSFAPSLPVAALRSLLELFFPLAGKNRGGGIKIKHNAELCRVLQSMNGAGRTIRTSLFSGMEFLKKTKNAQALLQR